RRSSARTRATSIRSADGNAAFNSLARFSWSGFILFLRMDSGAAAFASGRRRGTALRRPCHGTVPAFSRFAAPSDLRRIAASESRRYGVKGFQWPGRAAIEVTHRSRNCRSALAERRNRRNRLSEHDAGGLEERSTRPSRRHYRSTPWGLSNSAK